MHDCAIWSVGVPYGTRSSVGPDSTRPHVPPAGANRGHNHVPPAGSFSITVNILRKMHDCGHCFALPSFHPLADVHLNNNQQPRLNLTPSVSSSSHHGDAIMTMLQTPFGAVSKVSICAL